VWHFSHVLRTADDVIESLRARKDAIGLSNETLEDICGLTTGHADKVLGPSRVRSPSLALLMALVGALGLAVQLVARSRSQSLAAVAHRECDDHRISKVAVQKARPIVLARAARKAVNARWAKTTRKQRKAISSGERCVRVRRKPHEPYCGAGTFSQPCSPMQPSKVIKAARGP
jgi:hypothetical protein